jgi:hypothetical protein
LGFLSSIDVVNVAGRENGFWQYSFIIIPFFIAIVCFINVILLVHYHRLFIAAFHRIISSIPPPLPQQPQQSPQLQNVYDNPPNPSSTSYRLPHVGNILPRYRSRYDRPHSVHEMQTLYESEA